MPKSASTFGMMAIARAGVEPGPVESRRVGGSTITAAWFLLLPHEAVALATGLLKFGPARRFRPAMDAHWVRGIENGRVDEL